MSEAIPSDQPLPIKASARQIVESSGLPLQARALILDVVKRTRLWKREKAEVAHELVAHFRDGLDAGRSPDDLLATFGQPKIVAKLIARGKKRNRPLWWHMRRRMWQGLLLLIGFYTLTGLVLALRHPRISVDYVAELNKNIPVLRPDQYAWPIYRDALIAEREQGVSPVDLPSSLPLGDKSWTQSFEQLRSHGVLLEAAQRGGRLPSLGLRLGRQRDYSPEDVRAFGWKPCEQGKITHPQLEESTIAVLLPQVSILRSMSYLLAVDMLNAAEKGDAVRVADDYSAMLGFARQCREGEIVIGQLVATRICQLADVVLMRVTREHPEALRGREVGILHGMTTADEDELFALNLTGERIFMLDIAQRMYSDDGHGDGTITLDGMRFLQALSSVSMSRNPQGAEVIAYFPPALPIAALTMASRKELVEKALSYFASVEQQARRPLWLKLQVPGNTDVEIIEIKKNHQVAYLPLTEWMPSLRRTVDWLDESRALHEATMVAVALELWHERTGKYPDTLAELVPQYLPQMPVDHSMGQPLRYKIKDGRPLLYGLGKDGKDDGGEWMGKDWPMLPDKGDWVLYPPVNAE